MHRSSTSLLEYDFCEVFPINDPTLRYSFHHDNTLDIKKRSITIAFNFNLPFALYPFLEISKRWLSFWVRFFSQSFIILNSLYILYVTVSFLVFTTTFECSKIGFLSLLTVTSRHHLQPLLELQKIVCHSKTRNTALSSFLFQRPTVINSHYVALITCTIQTFSKHDFGVIHLRNLKPRVPKSGFWKKMFWNLLSIRIVSS